MFGFGRFGFLAQPMQAALLPKGAAARAQHTAQAKQPKPASPQNTTGIDTSTAAKSR